MNVTIDGGPLGIDEVVAVAEGRAEAVLHHGVRGRMLPARDIVERAVAEDRTLYGVTTGFGALASKRIDRAEAEDLQVRLLRSHAAGVGDPLPDELVRSMLLLRARTLAQGHSGVRPIIVERYIEFLREGLLPVVPSQGSVGASGDLAPFAHLALPIIGEGFLKDGDVVEPAARVLARHGLAPIRLRAKEGLSLLNGTEGMLSSSIVPAVWLRRQISARRSPWRP